MKILIFDADTLEAEINVKDKFVFIMADDKRVYHIDSTDGNMWQAKTSLVNLGEGHKREIEKRLTK